MMYEEVYELIKKGETNNAREQIERLPDKIPAKYTLSGLLYYQKTDLEKAKAEFEKALKIDPLDSDALFNYGYILKELNQEMEAWRYLMRISPKDWSTYDILGDIELKNRSELASLRFYKKAAEMTDNPEMKKKFHEAIYSLKRDTKIAFLCLPGLENFLKDIAETFSLGYDVRLIVSNNTKETTEAIRWADIVWLEWANDLAVFATNNVTEIKSKKVICRLHSYELFTQFPDQINWRNVDQLVFVGNHVKQILYELHPNLYMQSTIGSVVFNGVDLDKFKFSVRKPGYDLAIMAHVSYKKNPAMWLQILSRLKNLDNRYKLHLAGDFQDPRYKIYFDHAIKETGLQENLIFYGWINNVENFLEDKAYILSTSIHEGHPYNVLESMARGIKPIILNYRGSQEQWPRELTYNTLEEAVEKITEQTYDSEAYRRFIEDNYPLERQLIEIEQLFENLSSNDGCRGEKVKAKSNSASQNAHGDGEKTSNSGRSGKNPYPTSKSDRAQSNQFGKIWDEYSRLDSFQILNEPAAKTLRSEFVSLLNRFFLIRSSSILEVGTGSGAFSFELALRESQVTGIDIEESSINLARRLVNDLHFVPRVNFLVGDGFRLKDSGFRNFDIVFNMGVLEHFDDNLLIKMLQEMGESGKYVVVGVPWSGSNIYRLAKEFSIANNTWEYGFERDFDTLKMHFEKAGLYLLHEAVIGGVSEAHYLKRINPQAINTAIATYFKRFFGEEQSGNWLIAIGTKDRQCAECFWGLKENERISFENNSIEVIEKAFPSVSIVIPVYNKENFIKSCLENLSEIAYGNHEVVFVNDGSNESTLETLKSFVQEYKPVIPDLRLINLKENAGTLAARQRGIEQSNGEFVFFHDIDDKIYKNCLKYLAEDYQNFKSSNPMLTVSCALMRNGNFFGEAWYSNFWRSLTDIFITEFVNLSGRVSIINTLFKKKELVMAYRNLLEFLSAAGIKRMSVAEDSLLSDYMLFKEYVNKSIPVFYAYRGYECNDPNSSSQQLPKRISDIPINTAYLYNALKKIFDQDTVKELEKKALVNAKMLYGPENGDTFIKNYLRYKDIFNTLRL